MGRHPDPYTGARMEWERAVLDIVGTSNPDRYLDVVEGDYAAFFDLAWNDGLTPVQAALDLLED